MSMTAYTSPRSQHTAGQDHNMVLNDTIEKRKKSMSVVCNITQ